MYFFGASGHGKVIVEIAEELNETIDGFLDADVTKTHVFSYPVLHEVPQDSIEVVFSLGNNAIRKKLSEQFNHFQYKTLIHPKTTISKRTSIGEGTVVMAGVTMNSEAQVGKHCIINTNASIDHECVINDFVHISPNVALAGNVEVGEGTHVGIGATVIQGIKIGKWCTIGAGTVVIRDVPDYAVVVGNPGKIIKYNNV